MPAPLREEDLSLKYVFIDTNVLYHCKLFTEIEWGVLFEEKVDKIVLIIPNMVIEEIDKGKNSTVKKKRKRARKIVSKFYELEKNSFIGDKTEVKLSINPPEWKKLKRKDKKILTQSNPDHQIIAEILLFLRNHRKEQVLFVSNDFLPLKMVSQYGISTINWRDKPYSGILMKPEENGKTKPELEIHFENNKQKIELDSDIPAPDLLIFEPLAELLKKVPLEIQKMPINEVRNLNNAQEYYEAMNPSNKSDDEFEKEVIKYNKDLMEYTRYREVTLHLSNHGNKPFNDIDIRINAVLERKFIIDYYDNILKPIKPGRAGSTIISGYGVPYYYEDMVSEDQICHGIIKEETDRNVKWNFGYNVRKLKHGETIELYSIAIRIPKSFSTKEITLKCAFTQEEEGKMKSQTLKIKLI